MSLSSLPLAKEVLGINPSDEDWLQFCMTSASPFGDVVILAAERCAVIYVKKFDAEDNVFFKLSKTYYPEDEDVGNITSITYLPVSYLKSQPKICI